LKICLWGANSETGHGVGWFFCLINMRLASGYLCTGKERHIGRPHIDIFDLNIMDLPFSH
jgi:hypothetical protein